MVVARYFLSIYRNIQYRLYKRAKYGQMPAGKLCTHTPFEEDINHGDVVHPCVRYIPESYLGHKWWMVYTPYYAANDKTENPILCYADSDAPVPPTHWRVAYQVQGQPPKGYNSDPTLFFDKGKMYVMWRENLTERCEKYGYVRATFGAEVLEKGIGEVFGPLVAATSFEEDAEVSPTFLITKEGKYRCYAMHLRFHSPFIQKMSPRIKKILSVIARVLDLLGIWSQQKGYGYAIWESDDIRTPFVYMDTYRFTNCNKLYRPWHMDMFVRNNKIHAVVQTNQCNADICIAESVDGVHFEFKYPPLMTNKSCGMLGIYKPTAGVVNDLFYLYYTAQKPSNRKLNIEYCTLKQYKNLLSE